MRRSREQDALAKGASIVHPGGTQQSDEIIASSGITFQLWRLYQHAWLVCLFFPLVSLLRSPLAPWRLALGLVALLCFAASYTWLMWPHPVNWGVRARKQSRLVYVLFAALSLLVFVCSLLYGPAWLWLFIGVSAIAGMLLPLRSAFAAVILFTLLPLVLLVGLQGDIAGIDWWWIIALMLLVRGLGLDMLGIAQMGNAIRELHTARRELARLAVVEERERLSRDLHDLLGQTLSMITLKSELARHLVTEEPDRCVQELADIERVARQTLREVREAVAGYRQPCLESELEGARQLLAAAAIDTQMERHWQALPPTVDTVLAWTVREGVTNIIRHSRARRCHIHLAQRESVVYVEVLNDRGRGDQTAGTVRPGLGLVGLRERVSLLGGHLEAGPYTLLGTEYFRLRVELPIQNSVETSVLQEESS